MAFFSYILFEDLLLVFIYNVIIALLQLIRTDFQFIIFLSFQNLFSPFPLFFHVLFLESWIIKRLGLPYFNLIVKSNRFSYVFINFIINWRFSLFLGYFFLSLDSSDLIKALTFFLLNAKRFFIDAFSLSLFVSQLLSIVFCEFSYRLFFICFLCINVFSVTFYILVLNFLIIFSISFKFISLSFFCLHLTDFAFLIWAFIEFVLRLFRLWFSLNEIYSVIL